MNRGFTACLIAAVVLPLLAVPAARAGEDPPGCNAASVSMVVEVLDLGNPTLGAVLEGTVIYVRVTLIQPLPNGCNFFGGQLSTTLPDGTLVPLAGFGPPTLDVPVVGFAFPFQVVSTVPYIADPVDAIDGVLFFDADYGATVDQPDQANGTISTDPPLVLASATSFVPITVLPDCNANGQADGDDILLGFSDDVNGNGVPDECDDCNGNLVLDDIDIKMGTSEDCNIDALPDECDPGFAGETTWTIPSSTLFRDSANWDRGTPGPANTARYASLTARFVEFDDAACTELFSDPACTGDYCNDRMIVTAPDMIAEMGGMTYQLLTSSMPGVVVGESAGDDAKLLLMNTPIDAIGTLAAGSGRIGSDAGSFGRVFVEGPTTEMSFLQDLCVGCGGAGQLHIVDGGRVLARDAVIGDLAGSSGFATLSGAGSVWDVLFFLTINNGTLIVREDTVVTAGFDVFGGVFLFENALLAGDGTIDGTVVNFGELAPGESVGTFTVDGGYYQVGQIPELGVASGSLCVEIGGALPGEFDRLVVTGPVGLGGGLFIDLLDGFEPQMGQGFAAIDAPQLTGNERFDVAFTPGFAEDRFLRVEYGGQANTAGPADTISIVVDQLATLLGFEPDPRSVAVGDLPTGVVAADLDDDTDIDLAVTVPNADPMANGELFVLVNGGSSPGGTWMGYTSVQQIPVGVNPTAVAAGPINPGAPIDLAVTNGGDDTVMVFLNSDVTPGTFGAPTVIAVGANPSDIDIAQLNATTGLDLVVTNEGDNTFSVLNNDGSGNFVIIDTMGSGGECPFSVDPEDIDNDRDEDLVIAHRCDDTVSVVINETLGPAAAPGPGGFAQPFSLPVGDGPIEVIAVDLDLDALGLPEIVTVNEMADTVSVIRNLTGTTFAPAVDLPVGDEPRSITAVDVENDADLDLAVVVRNDLGDPIVQVLRNDLFADQLIIADAQEFDVGANPVLVTNGDVDGDGDGDLIAVNGASGPPPPGSTLGGSVQVELNTLIPPCPGDTNGSGAVDIDDIVNVILDFGTDGAANGGDVDGSGLVDIDDLVLVVLKFGACPGA